MNWESKWVSEGGPVGRHVAPKCTARLRSFTWIHLKTSSSSSSSPITTIIIVMFINLPHCSGTLTSNSNLCICTEVNVHLLYQAVRFRITSKISVKVRTFALLKISEVAMFKIADDWTPGAEGRTSSARKAEVWVLKGKKGLRFSTS